MHTCSGPKPRRSAPVTSGRVLRELSRSQIFDRIGRRSTICSARLLPVVSRLSALRPRPCKGPSVNSLSLILYTSGSVSQVRHAVGVLGSQV